MREIPVVDLAPFRDGSAADRKRVAAEVAQACETLGFLVVSGHGVLPADGGELHAQALRFCDRPLAEKMTVRRPHFTGALAYPDFAPNLWPNGSSALSSL